MHAPVAKPPEDDAQRQAFNRGCDARLAGLPPTANPFRQGEEEVRLFKRWEDGWWDVHRFWGAKVGGRWAYTPLPKVWWGAA